MTSHRLRHAIETFDADEIRACFASNATLHSPATKRPFEGGGIAAELVIAARGVLQNFRYTDELRDGNTLALVFRATVGGHDAEGLDLVRLDANDQVHSLTVMIRPLKAAIAFTEAMGPRAEALLGAA